MLYHLALRSDWERARQAGEYRTSTLGADLAEVGFVHCSFADQVTVVAEAYYAGVAEPLVLLVIDPQRLDVPVRVEPVPGGQRFPHVYGPIPVTAVTDVSELHRGPDGRLVIPVR